MLDRFEVFPGVKFRALTFVDDRDTNVYTKSSMRCVFS